MAWWSNDHLAVVGLYFNSIEVWDIERGQRVRELKGHTSSVYALDISVDQKLLLSASLDGTARLWNLDLGGCVHGLQGHKGPVYSAVFSRNGRRALTGSGDRTMRRLWDLDTGRCVRVLEGHTDELRTVAWQPSNMSLAVSGSNDLTVRVWNVDSGACLSILEGYSNYVYQNLHWSPDGQRLTSCDRRGTVIVWDLSRGGRSARGRSKRWGKRPLRSMIHREARGNGRPRVMTSTRP